MRELPITDDEAAAVLRGQTPGMRPDLASVAVAVTMFREASLDASPRPTAELALRLDPDRLASMAAAARESNRSTAPSLPSREVSTPRSTRRRVAFSGIVGLGLAAKIAIGVAAAAAVGLTGAGAAGAAGLLPAPAQEVFNEVTGHPGGEHVSESGLEHSEFGLTTAEEARAKAEAKRQAALEKAEAKRQAGLENAAEHSRNGVERSQNGVENATEAGDTADAGQAGLETADENNQTGREAAADAGSVADEKSAGQGAPTDAPRPDPR